MPVPLVRLRKPVETCLLMGKEQDALGMLTRLTDVLFTHPTRALSRPEVAQFLSMAERQDVLETRFRAAVALHRVRQMFL